MSDPRNQMWVTCQPCAWTWAIAFLPMEMGKLAKLMKGAACPKCGDTGKNIFMARETDIVAALAVKADEKLGSGTV